MKTLSEITPEGSSSALIWGRSGSGKTLLAGALSLENKLLYLDFERGIQTLTSKENPQLKEWVNLDNISYQPVYDTARNPQAHFIMRDLIELKDVKLCQEHGMRKCKACGDEGMNVINLTTLEPGTIVIIDSGSQVDLSIRSLVYGGSAKAWDGNIKANFDQYAQLNAIWDNIGTFIQQCAHLNIKIVLLAHSQENKEGDELYPSISTRNYSATFEKFFSTVVYTEAENKKYRWSITALDHKKAGAKNRAGLTSISSPAGINELMR